MHYTIQCECWRVSSIRGVFAHLIFAMEEKSLLEMYEYPSLVNIDLDM